MVNLVPQKVLKTPVKWLGFGKNWNGLIVTPRLTKRRPNLKFKLEAKFFPSETNFPGTIILKDEV